MTETPMEKETSKQRARQASGSMGSEGKKAFIYRFYLKYLFTVRQLPSQIIRLLARPHGALWAKRKHLYEGTIYQWAIIAH
jgi:hypothetical protein